MEIVKISVLILTIVLLISSIPTFSREITILITSACCIVVLLYILNQLMPAVEYIKNVAVVIDFDNIDIILKSIGVGFITQFVSDMALDCNNKTLANQMIFAGRIAVLLLAMPIFLQVFEIIQRLVQ